MPIDAAEDWGSYVRRMPIESEDGDDEGGVVPMFVRLDLNYLSAAGGGERCARVTLTPPDDWLSERGLPTNDGAEKMWRIEDAVSGAVAGLARHVATVTVPGLRDFVFVTNEPDAFQGAAEQALATLGVEADVEAMDDMSFYDEVIRPDAAEWHQTLNQKQLSALLAAGADPEKPHAIEHNFYGDADALAALRAELEEQAFQATVEGDHMTAVAARELDIMALNEDTDLMSYAAEAHGVEYDGWGAAVLR